MGEAFGWARERGVSADDDLSYLREFEHITLARVLLASYTAEREARFLAEAAGLLERLLTAAKEGGRTGSAIERLVLQALIRQTGGDIPAALASLHRALPLAGPEGYVRILADEVPPDDLFAQGGREDGADPAPAPVHPGTRAPGHPGTRSPGESSHLVMPAHHVSFYRWTTPELP